ncbi:DcrB-related protein [Pantoea sp. BAV 3049]|uniref:DcrB-related protein n=1 Tax=Pantoea sp. BAV 3049 TaxID=2654188 RepID=UPI00131C3505|nr:DcrB-related protein [Pantoea sp. BAV 3049]
MNNNSHYTFNEGKIILPENYIDRTVHALIDDISNKPGINISRDKLSDNQTLDDYLDEQYQQLIAKMVGWEQEPRKQIFLGEDRIPGQEITFSFLRQPEHRLWQKQAVFVIGDKDVLVFSLSKVSAFDENDQSLLDGMLQSFIPNT